MGNSNASSSAFSLPLELPAFRPRLLVPVLLLFHLSAAAPALLLELHWGLRLAWLGAVAALYLRHQRRFAVRGLRLRRDGSWQLELAKGWAEAELTAWFCQGPLCVLRFQSGYVVMLGGGDDRVRRLRARLRLSAQRG